MILGFYRSKSHSFQNQKNGFSWVSFIILPRIGNTNGKQCKQPHSLSLEYWCKRLGLWWAFQGSAHSKLVLKKINLCRYTSDSNSTKLTYFADAQF